MVSRLSAASALALAFALVPAGPGQGLAAQDSFAQPVVQALPSPEVQRLNRALLALARAPRDRDTLIEAGQAALGVDDLEAAIGFFGRAAEVDPGSSGAAQGLGSVYLRSGRAGEALIQFDRALVAGVPEQAVTTDRALSLDLVGEPIAAQEGYLRALQLDPANDEARRRLAISYAITGSRARFEETLRPLLDRRDMAAQRARAFGLAILGDADRATAIVEQVMPRDLATRLVPYLGYMPRLTKPQQAAAASLGIFPRAADIGRVDPRLARFAAEERADSRLAPSGAPLGSPIAAPAPVNGKAAAPPRVAPFRPVSVTPVTVSADTLKPPQQRVADAFADLGAPLPDARAGADAVDISRIEVRREVAAQPMLAPETVKPAAKPAEKPKKKEPPKPLHPSRIWVQVATGKKISALAFDWKRIAKEGGAPLAKLMPFTARWGETNRLLVGPLDSREKAQALVRTLKGKDLDSFLFVSDEGEAVQQLK